MKLRYFVLLFAFSNFSFGTILSSQYIWNEKFSHVKIMQIKNMNFSIKHVSKNFRSKKEHLQSVFQFAIFSNKNTLLNIIADKHITLYNEKGNKIQISLENCENLYHTQKIGAIDYKLIGNIEIPQEKKFGNYQGKYNVTVIY